MKVNIRITCSFCDGEAYLPVREAVSCTGEQYTQHRRCAYCLSSGKDNKGSYRYPSFEGKLILKTPTGGGFQVTPEGLEPSTASWMDESIQG